MKKYILYIIILFTGVLSGYIFIVLAGITYPSTLNIWIIDTVKEYKNPCIWAYLTNLAEIIVLILTGIPIFFLFGFFLNRFIKLKPYFMATISSIGAITFLYIMTSSHWTIYIVIIILNILAIKTIK